MGVAAIFVVGTLLSGCYEGRNAENEAAEGGDAGDAGDDGAPEPFCSEGAAPGVSPRLVRLTHRQYDNTLRDVFGVEPRLSASFIGDVSIGGYTNNAEALAVSDRLARDYRRAAERMGEMVLEDPAIVSRIVPCDPGPDPHACAQTVVAQLGRKLWRRALTPDETSRLLAVFDGAGGLYEGGDAFAQGVALVVESMLQSPKFLYRAELETIEGEADVVALDGWSVAARLSFALWNTSPDDALLAAAEAGELDTAAGVAQHARRMLADPKALDVTEDFHTQWLALDHWAEIVRDPDVYPELGPGISDAMREDTLRFVEDVVFAGGGTYAELMTSTAAFVDADLAMIYGVEVEVGDASVRVELDPDERAGLLTRAGFLAANAYYDETSPIHRGTFIQRRILCMTVPDPPGDADLDLPPPSGDLVTTRQRVEAHTSPDACRGCHSLLNPPGFAFEGYDPIGRVRTHDNGELVDTAASVSVGNDALDFTDGVDLAHQLATHPVAQRCYLTQWFRYVNARVEQAVDTCTLDGLVEHLEGESYDVRELLVALTQTGTFRFRTRAQGE
jgi:hypothetical protein